MKTKIVVIILNNFMQLEFLLKGVGFNRSGILQKFLNQPSSIIAKGGMGISIFLGHTQPPRQWSS